MRRSYQIPVRVADKLYIEETDGTRKEIDVLTAKEIAKEWADVVMGLSVYLAKRG